MPHVRSFGDMVLISAGQAINTMGKLMRNVGSQMVKALAEVNSLGHRRCIGRLCSLCPQAGLCNTANSAEEAVLLACLQRLFWGMSSPIY